MDGPTDLDALAEALREDGVVVDRVMGSGDALGAHDRIAALVREVPFPVYVALAEHPAGLPTDSGVESTEILSGLLHRRLGDGLYVVDTPEGIMQVTSYGLGADSSRLALTASANSDVLDETMQDVGDYSLGTPDYLSPPPVAQAALHAMAAEELVEAAVERSGAEWPPTVSPDEVEALARDAVATARLAEWRPRSEGYVEVRLASSGFSALVGTLSGLVIALLIGQTLRGWPRRGKPRPAAAVAQRPPGRPAPPDPEVERARAAELAEKLSGDLERVDWDTVADRDVAGRALTARDAVEALLGSDDVADLVGAQVVARSGSRDLARGRRGAGKALVTCFFDPRHPDAGGKVSWRLGDGEVDVPSCTACARSVAGGDTPDHLRLRARRGTAPYWERDDVWARTGFGSVSDFVARDVLADRAGER